MSIRGLAFVVFVLLTMLPLFAIDVEGAEGVNDADQAICTLILYQERRDLDEWELGVDLAKTRLAAAESIFELVDALWKEDLIERFIHLTAQHERDVARIDVKRQALLVKRQEALTEQFASLCSGDGSQETQTRREEAYRRYLQADCHRTGKDLAIAEVDLAYLSEVLESVHDLRENDVATRQDVIRAEEDVENARRRVEHYAPRVNACKQD
jgi:hypothetical protein